MHQQPGQLAWRSDLELRAFEWSYLKGVFAHERLQPLLQRGQRVLTPLPGGWVGGCVVVDGPTMELLSAGRRACGCSAVCGVCRMHPARLSLAC